MNLNSRKLALVLFFVLITLRSLTYYNNTYYYFDVSRIISHLFKDIIFPGIPVYMFLTLLISGTLWVIMRKQLAFIYLTNITLLVLILFVAYEKLGSFLVALLLDSLIKY